MKKRLLPFLLAGAMTAAFAAPVAASHDPCHIDQSYTGNRGGAAAFAALIAAAVNAADAVDVAVCELDVDVTVTVLNNSLNNLLRNADIDVLNNVLNNSLNNLLRNADIEVNVLSITGNTIVLEVLSDTVNIGDVTINMPAA